MRKSEKQPQVPFWSSGLIAANRAPRCKARRKYDGSSCQAPAMKNKRVCRLHGGASPGAPQGNQNALTTGLHTAKAKIERKIVRETIRNVNELVRSIDEIFLEAK